MKIKKIGHCCLVIDIDDTRILTDPGAFTSGQEEVENIDAILITHEHSDHLHVESLERVMYKNPEATVITNTGVANILYGTTDVHYTIVEDGMSIDINGISIEGHGEEHAEIYPGWKSVLNTGYFIGEKLFYPGDAFYDPQKPVDVLALPVAGPWMRIRDAIDYALKVNPKKAFPVHDGGVVNGREGSAHKAPEKFLPEKGIKFVLLKDGDECEF